MHTIITLCLNNFLTSRILNECIIDIEKLYFFPSSQSYFVRFFRSVPSCAGKEFAALNY